MVSNCTILLAGRLRDAARLRSAGEQRTALTFGVLAYRSRCNLPSLPAASCVQSDANRTFAKQNGRIFLPMPGQQPVRWLPSMALLGGLASLNGRKPV
jgi:hypothetical protein